MEDKKAVEWKIEGSKLVIEADTDKDGEVSLYIALDISESLQEAIAAVSRAGSNE